MKELLKRDATHAFIIVIYLLLFSWQLNWYPGERYAEWDNHWGDVRVVRRLATIERSLRNLELPGIDPYTGFGVHVGGDLYSPWNPAYLLVLLCSARTVIWLVQLGFMVIGGLGAYCFLRRFTENKFICLLGGLSYVSTWANVGGSVYFMHHAFLQAFYCLPFMLVLIHRVLEKPSAVRMAAFAAFVGFAFGSLDVFSPFVFPGVIFAYSLIVAWQYYSASFLASVRKAGLLLALGLLAGSIYLVPYYWNCRTIATDIDVVRTEIPGSVGPVGRGYSIPGLFQAINTWGGGYSPIWNPTETPMYGAVWVPIGFYLLILSTLIFIAPLFKGKTKNISIIVALLLLIPSMLLVDCIYWSPASDLFLTSFKDGCGIGPVPFNTNIIPFMVVLAAFIGIAALVDSTNKKLKIGIYLFTIVTALLVDLKLFGGLTPWIPFYESSNRIRLPLDQPLDAFPWLSLLAFALIVAYDFLGRTKDGGFRVSIYALFLFLAVLLRLGTITVYNDWSMRTGNGGRMVTRHPYRWDSHLQREAVIDKLIDRSDPNYRTLYCGNGGHERSDGRAWKAIAATEMHVVKQHKVLYTWLELTQPYEGLMYGLWSGGGIRRWQITPPLSRDVDDNIATAKGLQGIKYVLSIEEKLESPHLIYRGKCDTEEFPRSFYKSAPDDLIEHWSEVGPIFVYEVVDPVGVSFFVDEFRQVSRADTLRAIYNNTEQPWNDNVVYLETEPLESVAPHVAATAPPVAEAQSRIVQESSTSIDLQVATPDEKFLVLTYVHRPFWKAYIGAVEVPIYRAYGGFMCVKVPPGEHSVRFRYYPIDVYVGILLTALSLGAPLALIRIF